MKKKDYVVILIAMIIFSCINGFIAHSTKSPLLVEILRQQENISKSQSRLESKVIFMEEAGLGGQIKKLTEDQMKLGRQVALVEKSTNATLAVLKKVFDPRAFANDPKSDGPPPEDPNKVHQIPVDHSAVIGAKDAKVTIVEFVDFECSYCAKFHVSMAEAAAKFPSDVNYIVKNFPLAFHKNAVSAAKASFAAGEQGKYGQMVDLLLENGRNLNDETYLDLAESLNINVKKFYEDYSEQSSKWESFIQKDMELGEKVGVRGTPTFMINGKKTNARTKDAFVSEIQKILDSNQE